jgi:hypothetical protein
MYPRDAFMRLIDLARAGLLDLGAIQTRSFPLDALPAAMEAAATASGLECVVVKPVLNNSPRPSARRRLRAFTPHATAASTDR